MIFMEAEYTDGKRAKNMKVIGLRTRCMVKELFAGLIIRNIKEISSTIRDKVLASLNGTMGEGMKVSGKMESKMAKEHIFHQMEEFGREFGKMGRELDG